MKSYKSLRVLSGIIQVVAWIQLVISLIIALTTLIYDPGMGDYISSVFMMKLFIAIWIIIIGLFSFLMLYAFSQLISLLINSADNLQNLAENVYVIASNNMSNHNQNVSN